MIPPSLFSHRAAIGALLLSVSLVEVSAQTEAPAGTLTQHQFSESQIFPGTVRDFWIYVPPGDHAGKKLCSMVFQDGKAYVGTKGTQAPKIFDQLIAEGAMPPTVGVFVNPGVVPAPRDGALPRFNRSFEYDGLGDRYARFLIDEILPKVEQLAGIELSDDPNDRGIGGASSGAICALNAAWARPDQFRRVCSSVGTFVGLRGADELHSLVRKTEPKPLRIFLQDGTNDLNIYAGDWWMANQTMLRALEWAGYEVEHRWDDTGHGRKGEVVIFSDAMRFLWKDYPAPVTTHPERATKRRIDVTVAGEGWQEVAKGFAFSEGPAVAPNGDLYFSDIPNSRIHRIDGQGELHTVWENTGGANGLAWGGDGRLLACAGGRKAVVAYTLGQPNPEVLAEGMSSNDICIAGNGTAYFSDPRGKKIWRIVPGQAAEVVAEDVPCNGVLLSPDQSQLYVAGYRERMVRSYQIASDGTLQHGQDYFWLHLPPRSVNCRADGMTVDSEGSLYVATAAGIQVCDQAGRVNQILSLPGTGVPSNLCFSGNTLYVTAGDRVYRRTLSKSGVQPLDGPVSPGKPRL